jgi:hypothetical protein
MTRYLAEALALGGLRFYEAAHRKIASLPERMTRLLLVMDRSSWIRRKTLRLFENKPELFSRIIAIHTSDPADAVLTRRTSFISVGESSSGRSVGAARRLLRFVRAPCVLRNQTHIELNLNFVFGLDAQFTGRLDPEVGLFHLGLACVVAILQQHLHGDKCCVHRLSRHNLSGHVRLGSLLCALDQCNSTFVDWRTIAKCNRVPIT